MVTVDARKDYYADLGVSHDASIVEIKTKFKKLGEGGLLRDVSDKSILKQSGQG